MPGIPTMSSGSPLPEDEEFRAALAAYMRWACDRVVALPPVGSVVPQREQVPRWGWDGLES